ncbi:uncharacterized protein LOC106646638 [Copidosoma floridanum]|uniref:uncharacterized protein LOC106646638 n=1 Tax=Copidosoma floridanum TaxID=29053 RepID=UPI0006C977D8|nr:uncharacterized protein LOC106646638 [Copidosoma floridanum]
MSRNQDIVVEDQTSLQNPVETSTDSIGQSIKVPQPMSKPRDDSDVFAPMPMESDTPRARLSKHQQNKLVDEFKKNSYLSPRRALELARGLNLPKQSVLDWFGHQRQKLGARKKIWHPSPEQMSLLKREYEKDRYLDKARRRTIAAELGVDDKHLARWFANQRKKHDTPLPAPREDWHLAVPSLADFSAKFHLPKKVASLLADFVRGDEPRGLTLVPPLSSSDGRKATEGFSGESSEVGGQPKVNSEHRGLQDGSSKRWSSSGGEHKNTKFMSGRAVQGDSSEEENVPVDSNVEGSGIAKRKRLVVGQDQVAKLQKEFAKSTKIAKERKMELAKELNVSTRYIETWFSKRRLKENVKLAGPSLAPEATRRLEEVFVSEGGIPDRGRRHVLAEELNMSEKNLYAWFYRRSKKDKQKKTP